MQNGASQCTCLAEPCTWSPQSVLSSYISLNLFLTISLGNLILYPMYACAYMD